MNNVVFALIWESWRLSRRWYLWVLPVAFAFDYLIMRQAAVMATQAAEAVARGAPLGFLNPAEDFAVLLAPGAFMVNFILSMFATLLAISMGNRAGFPLAFEFRLPVRTSLLVAVPMLTTAALCASLYVLPILVIRLVYGVPIPLLPAGALIASLVVILLACSWSTSSSTARTFAMVLGIIVAGQLFALLDPVDMSGPRYQPGQGPIFNQSIVALTPGEYALLAGIGLILYALATASIRKQRCGEAPVLQLPGVAPVKLRKSSVSLLSILTRAAEWLMPSCPTSTPWRAELWLEARRQVLPILLLSVLIAVCVPLLYLFGITPKDPFDHADYIFPGLVFFVGVGMTVFNRRQQSAGYMSAFEGTRGMSTLALAAIQMLAVTAATFCGIALVLVSVHFASAPLEVPGNLALRIQETLSMVKEASPLYLFTGTIALLVNYVAWVLLLACIHTWSVIWGRWVPYGAGAVIIYAAAQAIRVQSNRARMGTMGQAELVEALQEIEQQLFAIAVIIGAVTLLALARTLYTKVLSLRVGAAALVVCASYVACSFYNMTQQDLVFSELVPEMQAFRAALLVCPFLLFILLLWSYDRLRHR
jgi:hypothetical protein